MISIRLLKKKFALSRSPAITWNYVVTTYMIVGLAGSYLVIFGWQSCDRIPAFEGRLAWRIYIIGILFLVVANLFTRSMVLYE